MSNNPKDQKFKKWLDILQQESWQLELIISGFAIYGLFLVKEPILLHLLEVEINNNLYAVFLWQGLMVSWFIITLNLILHVILRGLWIGAIGLRYVSADIDYEALNYSKKFNRHLLRRVGSFDNYVATLEKYCSIIFAVTFLLVFYLLGLLLISFLFTVIGMWVGEGDGETNYHRWIGIPLILFLAVGCMLTFIDFLLLGWLKKKRWTTFIYYPFYWVFKYITLSFLYRPMVYNFLDSKFGRRLSMFIVPLYLGIIMIYGTGFSTSNYLSDDMRSSSQTASKETFNDEIEAPTDFVRLASIPSKVITDPFLNVFVLYAKNIEDDVFYFDETLKPEEDHRGIFSVFSSGTVQDRYKKLPNYLKTINDMYTFKIDTLHFKPEFVIATNKRKQIGFETFIDMQPVKKGKHVLEIWRKNVRLGEVKERKIVTIPFWYFPD
ncbi:hypothetical protein [Ascidiimonas aurantiaca]|uniref:hypothetical protein n=1 Tax=Ascidiimonas aurantiaca TaxID=1685432 RepID=UPI0030EEDF30